MKKNISVDNHKNPSADLFEHLSSEVFDKHKSCHSAFGQIQNQLSTWKKDIEWNETDSNEISHIDEIFEANLTISLENPKEQIFVQLSTNYHTCYLNFAQGKVQLLSSWEAEYNFYEYATSGNPFSKLLTNPVKQNTLKENLKSLFEISTLSTKTRDNITEKGKQSVFDEEKRLIKLLFNHQYPPGLTTAAENEYKIIMETHTPTRQTTKFDRYKRYSDFGTLTWTYTPK